MSKLVTITIDGCDYQVSDDKNLLETCLGLGLDLSYFCWHPALGSVGSCRQCAVMLYQDASDTRGRLNMACTTPVTDRMIVSLDAEQASEFRATNIEALMTNHPHDCPVCEEGGDCHLQDMTLMSGHVTRRYPGEKRTHHNQFLGPLINHEMNRCIGCYRCVRFYRDYCDGDDLNVFGSKNQIYFGRAQPGVLTSHFSGNLAEVCPTGVFTDKTFSEHYCRKWDLQSSPSICEHCAVGCHTYTGSYHHKVRKISNRFNRETNGDFLCDKGRFSYQYANSEQRLTVPLMRNQLLQQTDVLSDQQATETFKRYLNLAQGNIVALGSSRTSIENNSALIRLLQRNGATDGDFFADSPDLPLKLSQQQLTYYQQHDFSPCSLFELEAADCALVIGEDLSTSAPRLALSLRQMTRNAGKLKAQAMAIAPWQDQALRNITQQLKSPLFIISHGGSALDDIAQVHHYLPLAQQLTLLQQIKQQLLLLTSDNGAAEPDSARANITNSINNKLSSNNEADKTSQAQVIATALLAAQCPVIIGGNNVSSWPIHQLLNEIYLIVATHNHHSLFHYVLPQANSMALAILANEAQGLDALLQRLRSRPPQLLIILEADLQWLYSQQQFNNIVEQYFESISHIVVIDHLITATAELADLILPGAATSEQQGCWLNSQGKLQLSTASLAPNKQRRPSWLWCSNNHSGDYLELLQWCRDKSPLLSSIVDCQHQQDCQFKVARQSFRASGRTAINAGIDVKEYPPPVDLWSNYQFSMEGVASFRQQHCDDHGICTTYLWQPKWNSNQASNKDTARCSSGNNSSDSNGSNRSCSIFTSASLAPLTPLVKTDSSPSITAKDHDKDPTNTVNPTENTDSTQRNNLTILPLAAFYNSNELSFYCPSLVSLMSDTVIIITTQTAKLLDWQVGKLYQVLLNTQQVSAQCQISEHCPPHSLLLSATAYRLLGLSPDNCLVSIAQLQGATHEQ
ncbi:MAG: NADH-quinone oxidoreductase subunit NuoG [Gammaproteobacteria bacterium]|nr:NADH-quinone oxidoreductase subunit NuoG [Gammaproteobacteria bacterium]